MITGKLCGSITGAVNSTYKGVSTDSIKVAVDNINNTISAKLLVNYKNQVFFFDKFVAGKNVQEQFTESEFVYCYDGTSIKGGDTGPNVILHFPQTSGRAIYLKKIHIKYIEDGISKEYNHEFIMGDFTAIGQIATLDNVNWELQNDTTDVYFGTYASEYGLQIGSNKKPARNLSLKTGDFIHKTIKEITVTACGAASADVLLSIDVGGFDWLYHENQADQATSIKLARNDISSPLSFTYKDGTTLEEAVITEYKNVFLRKDEDEIVVNQPQEEFLYINRENNRAYRFDGTTLVEVSKVLELGSTADTAYRGDWGQQNYTNIQNILNKDITLKGNKTIEGKLIVASAEGSYDDTLVIKPNDSSYPDIKIGYHDDGDMFATSVPALHVGHLSNLENNPLSYISCYSDISMENATILNVPDPINEKDVANKKYVDNNFVKNLGAAADYRVYMASPEGTNTCKSASNSAIPDTIPLRNNSGQLALPNQLIEAPGVNQAISKAYGDTKYLKAGTDINLEKNLEVNGTTKLTGGMEPLHTFNIGPYKNQAIILEIYQETTCSGIFGFDEIRTVQMFSGLCQYILKGYKPDGSDVIIKRYCVGTYYLDNNKELTGFVANCQGLQNKFSLITYDKNAAPGNIWSINDYLPEKEAQRKLWRHSLTLNGNIYWELISARKDVADGPANLAFTADASYGQSFIIDKSTIITYGTDMVWRIGDQEITTVSDNCTPINHNAAAD